MNILRKEQPLPQCSRCEPCPLSPLCQGPSGDSVAAVAASHTCGRQVSTHRGSREISPAQHGAGVGLCPWQGDE